MQNNSLSFFIFVKNLKNYGCRKNLPHCQAEVIDNFQLCWNCNYSFTEKKVVISKEPKKMNRNNIQCLRCPGVKMIFSRNYMFHEGTRMGVLGNLMELFTNRESFDVYICPNCGKIEFFTPE